MTDPLDLCSVRHVIDFECYGWRAKPSATAPAAIPRGTCWRCRKATRLLQCNRCGRYFCAPDLRGEQHGPRGAL